MYKDRGQGKNYIENLASDIMRKGILVLLAVMVILASLAFVNALPSVAPEVTNQLTGDGKINAIIYVTSADLRDQVIASLPENDSRLIKKMLGGIGFVAEINKRALDILANNSDIKEIYWDSPMGMTIIDDPQEPPAPIESKTLPYVDPTILPVFENQTRVDVLVRLIDISNITIEGTFEERRNLLIKRNEILAPALDNFLSNLAADDVIVTFKHTGEFTAQVTKEGFELLSNDPRVKEIWLEYKGIGYAANDEVITAPQNNVSQDQAETKSPELAKPQSFFQKIINFFKSLFRIK